MIDSELGVCLAWVSIYHHIFSLQDLTDGQIISQILAKIDPNFNVGPASTWILKFNNLTKISKLIQLNFESLFNKQLTRLPNLTKIARDDDEEELAKLIFICLSFCVQSHVNQEFISDVS
jgi:HOOK domain